MSIRKSLNKYIQIYKKEGFKAVIKTGGWKIAGIAILFFLVKGVLFYIILPSLFLRGFLN
jgi:hypothetical protein